MLFYDSPNPAPNPRRVRIYLAEKGLSVPTQTISIRDGEHRGDAFLQVNPLGQTPALVIDGADVLTESIAICRFFEALHPSPPMFGVSARGVEPQYTEFGESQRPRVVAAMQELDAALASREWLDGKGYSMADIVLLTTIDFAVFVGVAMPEDATALRDWHARATARPSAQA